jgi:hypothetical protein
MENYYEKIKKHNAENPGNSTDIRPTGKYSLQTKGPKGIASQSTQGP